MGQLPAFFTVIIDIINTSIVEIPRSDIWIVLPPSEAPVPVNFHMLDQTCLRKGKLDTWIFYISIGSPACIAIAIDCLIRCEVGSSFVIASSCQRPF